MIEAELIPVATEAVKGSAAIATQGAASTSPGILHSLGAAKGAVVAHAAANPIAAAVIAALALTAGAYYLGKFAGKRAHKAQIAQ